MSRRKPHDPGVPPEMQELIDAERRRLEHEAKERAQTRQHAWNLGSSGRPTREFVRTLGPQSAAARPALLGGPPPKGRGPGR